jgi:hypothetical protein
VHASVQELPRGVDRVFVSCSDSGRSVFTPLPQCFWSSQLRQQDSYITEHHLHASAQPMPMPRGLERVFDVLVAMADA